MKTNAFKLVLLPVMLTTGFILAGCNSDKCGEDSRCTEAGSCCAVKGKCSDLSTCDDSKCSDKSCK